MRILVFRNHQIEENAGGGEKKSIKPKKVDLFYVLCYNIRWYENKRMKKDKRRLTIKSQ